MKLTNNEIYNCARMLLEQFSNGNQNFPIKINFYLQKNKKTLIDLAQEIEKARLEVAQKYGVLDEEKEQYVIAPEDMPKATKELEDLFSLEQEVNIYKIDINRLPDDLRLTGAQMEALMFMIE